MTRKLAASAAGSSHSEEITSGSRFDSILGKASTPLAIIASVALLVHLPNLLNYPAWFFDEGAYLHFSLEWLKTGELAYYGHPFVPLASLAALFASVNPTGYLIPRILMVAFSAVDGILLFKIGKALYSKGEGFAFVASLIYVASPLSARYLRLVVVDNFMTLFLLASFLLIVTQPRDKIISALLFGGALASKQTALFFVPALLLYFRHQKRAASSVITWLLFAAIVPALWVAYGVYQLGGLAQFLASQLDVAALGGERAVNAGSLILQRITSRDPFLFVGLAGVVWALYRRDWTVVFPITYLVSFVVLFLKISVVYLIPVLPFFSLLGTGFLFDIVKRVPRLENSLRMKKALFGTLIIVLTISSLFLAIPQNPANPQQKALSTVAGLRSPTVIASYTYLWLISQNYPGITAYDRYFVPWSQLASRTVYLIVDYPGDLVTIYSIPQYQRLYFSSLSTAQNFTDPASGYVVQVMYGVVAPPSK